MSEQGIPDAEMSDVLPVFCQRCKKPGMKRTNFRTGSVDKPKADVMVCSKCGHRVELRPE